MTLPSTVLGHTYIGLRLPSGTHKVQKIIPDTIISLGKYGSFPANQLIGRPYYHTFEILEQDEANGSSDLRIVPPIELYAETLAEEASSQSESQNDVAYEDDVTDGLEDGGANGDLFARNNRLTVDDPSRQALTMAEIEALKREAAGSGKEIIAKIMQSHSALDEKTAFSLAKYTLRKNKKYLRRFVALPLDLSLLASWMLHEKDAGKVLEIREEMLGLICSWANIRFTPSIDEYYQGRWLVVDDSGGLVVAALAERMGILYPFDQDDPDDSADNLANESAEVEDGAALPLETNETSHDDSPAVHDVSGNSDRMRRPLRQRRHPQNAMSATHNSITLLHSATQPNISLLSYFGYNPSDTSTSDPYPAFKHPLHTHLKTVNWLQLLSPELDGAYTEPEFVDAETVATWKTSKRGNYFRKRRRWECAKRVVDETRAGGFDGLVIASTMDPVSILHHTVPLLKGGAQIAMYSPSIEPLVDLMDLYSSTRRTAYINLLREINDHADESLRKSMCPSDDFPVDPRLVLAPSLQTVRATEWQVLPGRTHPLMTGRGGAEGYLFSATRVVPFDGKVEARGRFSKKRKTTDLDVILNSD